MKITYHDSYTNGIQAQDLNNLIRWSVDTDGVKFAKEIYNKEQPDEYTRGKFHDMQSKLVHWVANLDYNHRQRLCDAINNNPTNEEV